MTEQQRPDLVLRAHQSWGDAPDWVLALAEAAMGSSQRAVAADIGYSSSVVSQTISNTYTGDMSAVEERVRGALLKEQVTCPVLGSVKRNTCLDWQKKPLAPTSGHRMTMYRACRSGCLNSRLFKEY